MNGKARKNKPIDKAPEAAAAFNASAAPATDNKAAPESQHIVAVKNHARLAQLSAGRRFRVVDGRIEKYQAEAPVIEDVVAAAVAAEERAREEAVARLIAAASPGQMIEGHGVFLGVWEPKENNSLKKKFNVFAAAADLQADGNKFRTYDDTVALLGVTKNLHGHDGVAYKNDRDLYAALANGSYKGEWFIPPRELLVGSDTGGVGIRLRAAEQPDNIYDHMDEGVLKGTFCGPAAELDNQWYWSSTVADRSMMWTVRFLDGYERYIKDEKIKRPCRPVRLEPIA